MGNGSPNAPDCDGSQGGIPLRAANLVTCYDVAHWHSSFTSMWNNGNMNGACNIQILNPNCGVPTCPVHMSNHTHCPQYQYVDNSAETVQPFFDIATYGFANYMFATNQGPSFPAHQFILSGTSAPVVPTLHLTTLGSLLENPFGSSTSGCIAPTNEYVKGINPTGGETNNWHIPPDPFIAPGYPCYEHQTLTDLLDNHSISWKYYAPSEGSLWTVPNAINHMCVPNAWWSLHQFTQLGNNGRVVLELNGTNTLAPCLTTSRIVPCLR